MKLVVATIFGIVLAGRALGADPLVHFPILSNPGDASFGRAMALDGDTLVVAGSEVAIFRRDKARDEWQFETLLLPPNLPESSGYGSAVAVDHNTVVVGASSEDAAYVFVWDATGWSVPVRIEPAQPIQANEFGFSVDISGDIIAVSDLLRGIYVFQRVGTGWQETEILRDSYGLSSVAADGDLIVGASQLMRGCAVFSRASGEWRPEALLGSEEVPYNDRSIAICGDTVVLGDAAGGGSSGPDVSIFRKSRMGEWELETLSASIPFGSGFGSAVAVSGDLVVVGEPTNLEFLPSYGGVAYVGLGPPDEEQILVSSRPGSHDFGRSVAVGDGWVFVADSGRVYPFAIPTVEFTPIHLMRHETEIELTMSLGAAAQNQTAQIGVEYTEMLGPGPWLDLGNLMERDGALRFRDADASRGLLPSGYYRAFKRRFEPQ